MRREAGDGSPGALGMKLCLMAAALTIFPAQEVFGASLRNDVSLRKSHSHYWDHLVFAQQWPGTACKAAGHHKCVIPKDVTTWTVHGMWPSLGDTRGPNYCNDSWHFEEAKIMDLEHEMNVSWPNFFTDSPLTSFWKHEWTKHGTCAASLPALRGEHNYFGNTLNIRAKYPIGELLSNSAIYAREEPEGYDLNDIAAALRGQMQGKVVSIHCFDASYFSSSSTAESNDVPSLSSSHSRQYLYQVEICFDKQLEPIDCPDTGSCQDNRPIYYPPIRKPTTFSLFEFDGINSPILVL